MDLDEIQDVAATCWLLKLMLFSFFFCTATTQERELCWCNFMKYMINIVLHPDICELICFKFGVMNMDHLSICFSVYDDVGYDNDDDTKYNKTDEIEEDEEENINNSDNEEGGDDFTNSWDSVKEHDNGFQFIECNSSPEIKSQC